MLIPTPTQCKAACDLLRALLDDLPAKDRDFAVSLLNQCADKQTLSPKQYGWVDYLAARVLAGGTLPVPEWLKTAKMKQQEKAYPAKPRGTHAATLSKPTKGKPGNGFKPPKHKNMSYSKDSD